MRDLLLIITAMSACVASAMHIEKRANSLRCDTPDSCVSSYETGGGTCADGYTQYYKEVGGQAAGSYCEKACDSIEKMQCTAEQCGFYEDQCTQYPGNTICAKALSWCGTPVITTPENCVQLRMEQPVKYDSATGYCEVDPDAPTDEYFLRFVIGKTTGDLNLYLNCAPVTSAGMKSIIDAMENVSRYCELDRHPGVNKNSYEITWRCKESKETFARFKEAFQNACSVAAHPGAAAPTSNSYTN